MEQEIKVSPLTYMGKKIGFIINEKRIVFNDSEQINDFTKSLEKIGNFGISLRRTGTVDSKGNVTYDESQSEYELMLPQINQKTEQSAHENIIETVLGFNCDIVCNTIIAHILMGSVQWKMSEKPLEETGWIRDPNFRYCVGTLNDKKVWVNPKMKWEDCRIFEKEGDGFESLKWTFENVTL